MPLYGHELDETTSPYEAGLGFAVKLDKEGGFIGREALLAARERGVARRLRGFRVEGRRVARQGMAILRGASGEEVGRVTSGAPSPTLGCPIALGYVSTGVADGEDLSVDVRGNRERLTPAPLPFFSRTRKPSGPASRAGTEKGPGGSVGRTTPERRS
jgi:aminomethyltransferase